MKIVGTTHMQDLVTKRLVQQAITGDREAVCLLWENHRRWVAAILLAHLPREAELDDLLQEVAASVVARIGGLRDAGAFKPWLRAVALNAASTAGRRRPSRAARVLTKLGLVKDEAGEGHGDAIVQEADEGRRVMELACRLPDGYREPLLLRCVQGMSYREIGEATGLPETTVETRIARGRRMLRELADTQRTTDAGGLSRTFSSGHKEPS
ncbi:MAG: RNA polymerase sigma factor [Pirellulaceae bacterium]|nr:RNA polymerase sigma factor [Pirellulaceae bacterium]